MCDETVLHDVVRMLGAADARDEALATLKPPRKLMPGQPTLLPVGRAWRLGVLLIDRDARLYAVGYVTRAIEPKDFNSDKTVAGEQRRAEQRAAARGPFERGDTVNYGFEPLDLGAPSTPLGRDGNSLTVTDAYGAVPLERYLRDHAALLIDPL